MPKQLSDTTKIAMGAGVFFMLTVMALMYEIFLHANKSIFLYLMLIVDVVVSVTLILALPILELRIRKNTRFEITRSEVISHVGRKIKITKMTPSLFLVVVKNPITCAVTVGFNVKNGYLFDQMNPVFGYFCGI